MKIEEFAKLIENETQRVYFEKKFEKQYVKYFSSDKSYEKYLTKDLAKLINQILVLLDDTDNNVVNCFNCFFYINDCVVGKNAILHFNGSHFIFGIKGI